MIKSFFGVDLKTGRKVILLASFVENMALYILSQLMLVESKAQIRTRELGSTFLHQNGLEHQEKFCELKIILKVGNVHEEFCSFSVSSTIFYLFGAAFSLLGGAISVLGLLFVRKNSSTVVTFLRFPNFNLRKM